MKPLISMIAAAVLLLGCAGPAHAADIKAKGNMQSYGKWMDNWDFRSMKHGAASEDDFQIENRVRIQLDIIANDNLKGVVQFQIGTDSWGNGGFAIGQGDSAPALSSSLRTRLAYLTYNLPDTKISFTGGYYTVDLPETVTPNRVMSDELAALSMSAPLIDDTLSVLALYGRAFDLNLGYGLGPNDADGMSPQDDEFDIFVLGFPVTMDGISFTPYGIYGHAGKEALNGVAARSPSAGGASIKNLRGLTPGYLGQNSLDALGLTYTENANIWWGGTAFEMSMFDPFILKADFVWGSMDTELADENRMGDRTGWYMDVALIYEGLDFMNTELVFAYGSGDDDDMENGSERLPYLRSNDTGYGSFYYGYGSAFADADRSSSTANDPGQWFLGLGFTEISLLDKLTHDIYLMWIQGTNDHRLLEDNPAVAAHTEDNLWGYYLTDKDHILEMDLNTQYHMFEELSVILELGVLFARMDEDVWHTQNNGDNSYKAALGFLYSF